MPSRGWRLIRFDMRLSVICLWPGLLSKLAGIIKREEVMFKERGDTSVQMKTEVGGQREERNIEAYPVSCLLWRPLPNTNHQSANNNSRATILFTVEKGSLLNKILKYSTLLSALLCTWFKVLVFWGHLGEFFLMPCLCCQPDQRDPRLSHFPRLKCVFS